jgi:hypothetical protein
VDAYRDRLAKLHDFIERHGPFVAYAQRLLIEARRKRLQDHPAGVIGW